MERIGFRLALNPSTIDQYVEHHQEVWPEMRVALSENGWHNYSLFIDRNDSTLIGYFETPDLESALDAMAATEVNAKWQNLMAPFFKELNGKRPDEGFLQLENIFYLP
ncbi:MAG: L-rhamnose mutarotase [Candidatus Planktophila sp.]|nr:L-rhamnose mutarotase [Candidatus Planktophila sp.]